MQPGNAPAPNSCTAGSAMVLLAKAAPGLGGDELTLRDTAGLGLALLSAFSLAAYMVLVQVGGGCDLWQGGRRLRA